MRNSLHNRGNENDVRELRLPDMRRRLSLHAHVRLLLISTLISATNNGRLLWAAVRFSLVCKDRPQFARYVWRLLFGKNREIVVPAPTVLSAAAVPPWASTRCLTIAKPSPVPPSARDLAASTR